MSLRDWLQHPPVGVGLIVAFMLLGAGALEHEKRYAECRYSRPNQNCDRTFEYVGYARIPPISRVDTPPRDKQPQRDQWRGEQDLQAQWDMSRWAFWTAFAAFLSVFVTTIGVIYVARTLDATRAAVNAANRTADEAKRIGEAQVRAYLSAREAECGVSEDWFWCHPRVVNSGQSPAISTEISAYVAVMGGGPAHKSKEAISVGPQIAAAGGDGIFHVGWTKYGIGSAEFDRLAAGNTRFDVFCRLNWVDVFGIENSNTFLIEVNAKGFGAITRRLANYRGSGVVITNLSPGDYDA